jgi:hypothetical protein
MAKNPYHNTEIGHWQPELTKIVNGTPVRFRDICVHEIRMGDVEDPDLFVASPILEWQKSESGKFIMDNAVEPPYWIRMVEPSYFGYVYRIMARLSDYNETFYQLKWGNK